MRLEALERGLKSQTSVSDFALKRSRSERFRKGGAFAQQKCGAKRSTLYFSPCGGDDLNRRSDAAAEEGPRSDGYGSRPSNGPDAYADGRWWAPAFTVHCDAYYLHLHERGFSRRKRELALGTGLRRCDVGVQLAWSGCGFTFTFTWTRFEGLLRRPRLISFLAMTVAGRRTSCFRHRRQAARSPS